MNTAAAAERCLSARHRDAWPKNLYAVDADQLRADGRFVLVETPAGSPTVVVEYKAWEAGPLDLGEFQYETLRGSVHPGLPSLVVQFTHPDLGEPWTFRLHPNNGAANDLLGGTSWVASEQTYVQWLYVVRDGYAAPGATG